ncbi:hypothetical protein C8E87_1025 [Paractinoplanes brasiliensis]|uniref:Uncharacterized protein n=1 Tax=Paractinoplanes brasiliensis TaxID=52695 RepID=A0A4V3C7I2_9ACTN|nr:hypothetical protein C8E87_1025 [Actinoplanes brasiliensis]
MSQHVTSAVHQPALCGSGVALPCPDVALNCSYALLGKPYGGPVA